MSIEVDFLGVETAKSGDAIAMRYIQNGRYVIHLVDGGYIDTSDQIITHLNNHYGGPRFIDHVVLSHPDSDHANGLRKILEEYDVGTLWMLRPWSYLNELLPRFKNFTSEDGLRKTLKESYAALAELEDIAVRRKIAIAEPFQGTKIGIFTVMTPTKARYLDLVVNSEKTPDATQATKSEGFLAFTMRKLVEAASSVKAAWGVESFPTAGTSCENEMSVIQYAFIENKTFMLTADAGRDALNEAIAYAPQLGLNLPGVNFVQVPHHGGRHNVSTQVLNDLLGPVLAYQTAPPSFAAICSSAKADPDHPRKVVQRAFMHRGAHFSATEGRDLGWSVGISRPGWNSVPQAVYPDEVEE